MTGLSAKTEAEKLIEGIERSPGIMCWEDAAPMILALGGSVAAIRDCDHSASLCIYIAALMVRHLEEKQ